MNLNSKREFKLNINIIERRNVWAIIVTVIFSESVENEKKIHIKVV